MKCTNCGYESIGATKYCNQCGTLLPIEDIIPEVVAANKNDANVSNDKANKKAEKEANKKNKADAKKNAKTEKAKSKLEAEKNIIEACPKGYKPVSYSTYFWLMLINCIPAVGLLFSFFASFIGTNRNIKRFERAAFTLLLILTIVVGLFFLIYGVILQKSISIELWMNNNPYIRFGIWN